MNAAEYRAYVGASPAKSAGKQARNEAQEQSPVSTPPAPPAPAVAKESAGRKQQQQREPTRRPVCNVAQYEGYDGKRFVAVGLSEEQTAGLMQRAVELGIQIQQ